MHDLIVCFSYFIVILIGVIVRVFINGLENQGSIPIRDIKNGT